MASWPPQLRDVLKELPDRDVGDEVDPVLLARLDAAVAYVEGDRGRAGEFNFSGAATGLPDPPRDVFLGTVLLAMRWYNRRNSPDGLVDLGELGSARIPSVDPDIERMLGVGRFRAPMVG